MEWGGVAGTKTELLGGEVRGERSTFIACFG